MTRLEDLTTQVHISVVIPAYNEESRIGRTLEELIEDLTPKLDGSMEILVMMDGSTDGTSKIVENIAAKYEQIIPIYDPKKLGKGGALLRAFEHSRGEIIVFVDADLPTSCEDIVKVSNLLSSNDLIIGSRYVIGSEFIVKPTLTRLFLSRSFNVLIRLVFRDLSHISDTQCGVKAMRRNVLTSIKKELIITTLLFDVNLIYSTIRHGFSVHEMGISWKSGAEGSKISRDLIRVILSMLISIVRLRLYYSRARLMLDSMLFRRITKILSYYVKN